MRVMLTWPDIVTVGLSLGKVGSGHPWGLPRSSSLQLPHFSCLLCRQSEDMWLASQLLQEACVLHQSLIHRMNMSVEC